MSTLSNVLNDKPLSDAYTSLLQYIPSNFHVTGQCPIPQILIPEIDDKYALNFPLSESTIQTLLQISKPSLFGKGTETTFDENIRVCKELHSKQFTVNTNTFSFSSKSNPCLESIRTDLMPHIESIHCRPYKLLMYETDSFFQSHVDTALDDRQFGTLILSFPLQKQYEGGEFMLHSNTKAEKTVITWNPDTTHHNVCEYISYFSDMEHEIKPIKSGIRIVMTFNLFISGSIRYIKDQTSVEQAQNEEESESDESKPHNVYVTPTTQSSELELNKYYSPYVQQVFDAVSACKHCKELHVPHALIWMIVDYNGEHKAIQMMRQWLNDDDFCVSDAGYENGICIILSHLYHGEHLSPLCLKGEDMHLFRILKQYFGVLLSRVTVKVVIGIWSDEVPTADWQGRVIEQWDTDHVKALRSLHIGDDDYEYEVPLALKGRVTKRSKFLVVYNNEASALKHGELQNIYDTVYGNCGAYNIHNLYRCAGLVLTRYKPENENENENEKKRSIAMDKESQPPFKKQKHRQMEH